MGRISVSAPHGIVATDTAYHWGMSRIHPECPDSGLSNRSVGADVLLRQEPDEEENEEDDEGDGKENADDDEDDGYSE